MAQQTEQAFRPTASFLSSEDRERIEQAALHILESIGMRVLHAGALELLARAGCAVDGDRVTIPASLVREAIGGAPRSIDIYDRLGRPAMDLGGRRTYFGTGSDLLWTIDRDGRARHTVTTDDVRRAAQVCDALPNIDFIMSFGNPSTEVPPHRAYLVGYHAMATSSVKPIVSTSDCREDLAAMWSIAATLRGGEETLRREPYLLHYTEPASALKHPRSSIDKLLFCAEKGIPLIYSPAPMAGATGPITIAGHVALGLSECLCGLVIHQLQAPGAPFLMGMGPAVLDLSTGQSSYNAPEYLMSYMAMIEMTRHFDRPSWGYAGTSDSQIPDEQATLEATLLTFLSTIAGANLNHDVGYLDFGRAGSLQMIVLMNEIIDQLRRIQRGIPVNDATLALDAIAEVGPSGNYIGHKHTMQHFRTTQWRPKLLNRHGRDKWEAQGATTLIERAGRRLDEIFATHQADPVEGQLAATIQAIVDGYQPTRPA